MPLAAPTKHYKALLDCTCGTSLAVCAIQYSDFISSLYHLLFVNYLSVSLSEIYVFIKKILYVSLYESERHITVTSQTISDTHYPLHTMSNI